MHIKRLILSGLALVAMSSGALAGTISNPCDAVPISAQQPLWPVIQRHLIVVAATPTHVNDICRGTPAPLRDVFNGSVAGCVTAFKDYQGYYIYVSTGLSGGAQLCILRREKSHLEPNLWYGVGDPHNGNTISR